MHFINSRNWLSRVAYYYFYYYYYYESHKRISARVRTVYTSKWIMMPITTEPNTLTEWLGKCSADAKCESYIVGWSVSVSASASPSIFIDYRNLILWDIEAQVFANLYIFISFKPQNSRSSLVSESDTNRLAHATTRCDVSGNSQPSKCSFQNILMSKIDDKM